MFPQRTLSRKSMGKIVDMRLKEVLERLSSRKIVLDVDSGARQYLASVGYSPTYGARPLNRAIQSELLNPLSVILLSEQVRDGEVVRVRFDGPHNRLVIVPNHEGTGGTDTMEIDSDEGFDEATIEEIE
jgi:ATP-dependent Clp protease ATP-binding subunit ClpB